MQSHIQRGIQYKLKHQITLTATASTDHVLDENGILERKAKKTSKTRKGMACLKMSVCLHSCKMTASCDSTQEEM